MLGPRDARRDGRCCAGEGVKGGPWLQGLNFKFPICFQEQEKEARSRAAYISALPASPHWGRGFDEDKDEDEGSPGGCNPAGGNGGDFHRLVF